MSSSINQLVYCVSCRKYRNQSQFLLQCNHSLCLNCLQDQFNNLAQNYIECKSCNMHTNLDYFEKELEEINQYIQAEIQSNQHSDYTIQNKINQQTTSSSSQIAPKYNSKMHDESNNKSGRQERSLNTTHDKPPINSNIVKKQQEELINEKSQEQQSRKSSDNPFNNFQNQRIDSNGALFNSLEISSITPQQIQVGESYFIQNYSINPYNSLQQSYTSPVDEQQIINNKNLNDSKRKTSLCQQYCKETELSHQNCVVQSYNQITSDQQQYQLNKNNLMNQNTNDNKKSISTIKLQSCLKPNYGNPNINQNNLQPTNENNTSNNKQYNDSIFNMSNSSISNIVTAQSYNNISSHPHNINISIQQSSQPNNQSQTADQSFSQSFISPNQQQFAFISSVKCKIHPEEEANLFCFQCHNNCLCVECFIGNNEHKDHDVKNVRKSYNQLTPLVQNLKDKVTIQINELKNDEQLIINRQQDIQNLCSETLTHLNRSIKEVILQITEQGEILSKEVELFLKEQQNEISQKHNKIGQQLKNLQAFEDSYEKILNFQGKCSEARMFNYFSDTKEKVNKYILKLQKQNEEIRNICKIKYTSCYPEHIFKDIQHLIQQIQIPFSIGSPLTLPSQLSKGQIQNPINNSSCITQPPISSQQSHQKKASVQFEDQKTISNLNESKFIEQDQDWTIQVQQLQQQNENNSNNSSQHPLFQKSYNILQRKGGRDLRFSSGYIPNMNQINNVNLFNQNFTTKQSNISSKIIANAKEIFLENNYLQIETTKNQYSSNLKKGKSSDISESQPLQQMKNNLYKHKTNQFQFINQNQNKMVKQKLLEMPFMTSLDTQANDSFIIQNGSTKNTFRKCKLFNNENIFENGHITPVNECATLIKNALKTRTNSQSQLRERSNPTSLDHSRYKTSLIESRYNSSKNEQNSLQDNLFLGSSLTQKSTDRERITSKSNDKKIKDLKKILNEVW